MTVNTQNITSGPYAGNDIVDAFPYTFRIDEAEEVSVYETDPAGVVTLLTLTTHYTVDGLNVPTGGDVTRVAGPLPSDYTWYIRSNYIPLQLTALASQGGFLPAVHEYIADKLTFLTQQLTDQVNRSIKLDISDPSAETANMDLPGVSERGNKTLAFDSLGDTVVIESGVGLIQSSIVSDIITLRNVSSVTDGESVYLKQRMTPGDNGGGYYRGVTGAGLGTYSDDGFFTIMPLGGDGSAAWLRELTGTESGPLLGYMIWAKSEQAWSMYVSGEFRFDSWTLALAETAVTVAAGDKYLYIHPDGTFTASPIVIAASDAVLIAELGLRFDVEGREFIHDGIDAGYATAVGAGPQQARNAQIWKRAPIDDETAVAASTNFRAGRTPLAYINRACGSAAGSVMPDVNWKSLESSADWNAGTRRLLPASDGSTYSGYYLDSGYIFTAKYRTMLENIYIKQGVALSCIAGAQIFPTNANPTGCVVRDSTLDARTATPPSASNLIATALNGWTFERVLGLGGQGDFIGGGLNDTTISDCASIQTGLFTGQHADGIQFSGQYGYEVFAPVAIASITQANPGVFTKVAHTFVVGTELAIVPGDMVELPTKAYVKTIPTADTFTIETVDGVTVDTTLFTPYTAGGTVERKGVVVTNDGTMTNSEISGYVCSILGEDHPWGPAGVLVNACVYISCTFGNTDNVRVLGGYLTGGTHPLKFEHRNAYKISDITVKDVLLGLDNVYGFASFHQVASAEASDPFTVWENVRRVDSGELIRKPALNESLTWIDYL